MLGVNNLVEAARRLSSVGIDVNDLIEETLRSINKQITELAYKITDIDDLLNEAQSIGDEIVQTEEETQQKGTATPNTEKNGDSSKGHFGESS
jgi:predicted ATP-grasp superfamily ATP-dependent carboligase